MLKDQWNGITKQIATCIRWVMIALITGVVIGPVGALFVRSMGFVTSLREQHPMILLGLPFAGLVIVFLYKICNYENDGGTNLVISTLHAKSQIPFRMAPLIFVSTIITHLFGGSAGREGAALQLGGSIANQLGRWFHMDEDDIKIIVRSGMSAAFSAIFGTPLAAVVFALEVGNVGNMHYAALVPCMLASLVASSISTMLGAHAEAFTITEPVSFSLVPALKIAFLGICCALISVLFCYLLHKVGHLLKEYFKNAYVRILVGSVLVIGLTVILQTTAYSGAGVNLIEEAFAGTSPKTAFIWKMIFTAITLGAGFKGGEIVPSFTIGATFGCLFGIALGLSPSLCAAVAMVSVFCGVTNCPIASLLIGFELFGFGAMKYLLIGISITYLLSGYGGLYSEQTIVFSKLEEKIINKKAQ
jgi:H+/Cl- antiporter ClcA